MTNKKEPSLNLNKDFQEVKNEINLLLNSLDSKRIEFCEATEDKIKKLEASTVEINNISGLFHSVPKKMSNEIKDLIPDLAKEIYLINKKNNEEFLANCDEKIKSMDEATMSNLQKIQDTQAQLEKATSPSIRKYLIGVTISMLLSISVAGASTYLILKKYPIKIDFSKMNNVTVKDSDVSVWGTNTLNISGKIK